MARSSPVGRTSTAQGIIGASGTIATIAASLLAGYLASTDLRLPFWATGIVSLVALGIGLLIGRRRLYVAMQPRRPAPVPAAGDRGRPLTDRPIEGTLVFAGWSSGSSSGS